MATTMTTLFSGSGDVIGTWTGGTWCLGLDVDHEKLMTYIGVLLGGGRMVTVGDGRVTEVKFRWEDLATFDGTPTPSPDRINMVDMAHKLFMGSNYNTGESNGK